MSTTRDPTLAGRGGGGRRAHCRVFLSIGHGSWGTGLLAGSPSNAFVLGATGCTGVVGELNGFAIFPVRVNTQTYLVCLTPNSLY